MELHDRVALVTGGGTGLGRAIALALAEAGARVAITFTRSEESAAETERQLQSRSNGLAIRSDVTDWEAVDTLVSTVEDRLGPISVLVNNAGVTRYVSAEDLASVSRDDWRRILDVNLVGAFACARAVAHGMRGRGEGSILNVASNSAFTGDGSSIPYVVSKAALVSLTRVLARALAPQVRVNAVAPGWMATDWLDHYLPPERREAARRAAIPPVPVEQVAAAALGLIRADAITGQVLIVDNGELAGLGLVPTQEG